MTYSSVSSHPVSPTAVGAQYNDGGAFPLFAKPFDRFKPQGGGAEGDIFRRFKIRRGEEIDFFMHWNSHNISTGIFNRDESGTLVFRVSSSDISDLTLLGIGRAGLGRGSGVEWTHVYDEHGISWLTQFRRVRRGEQVPNIFDGDGRPILWHGSSYA
jgi:hypothetical protein